MSTSVSPVAPSSAGSSSASSSACCGGCDRTGLWYRPVETCLDFTLDLNLDPAADRGCGPKESKKDPGSKTTASATDGTPQADSQARSTTERRRRSRPQVFNTANEMETDEEDDEEDEDEDDEDEEDEGNESEEESSMAVDQAPEGCRTTHQQPIARVNLLEPEGIETRLCSRHVEQLMRERLFLFGEDCRYSLWWFPKPDYAAAVWRTDEGPEGAGLFVGDPDLINLNNQAKAVAAAAAAAAALSSQYVSDSLVVEKPTLVPQPPSEGESALKKRKTSIAPPTINVFPVPSAESCSTSNPSTPSPSLEGEADGIGEELKNLILNEAIAEGASANSSSSSSRSKSGSFIAGIKPPGSRGMPSPTAFSSVSIANARSHPSDSPATSSAPRAPLRLFMGNTGVLSTKKALAVGSPGRVSRAGGGLRTSSSSIRLSSSSLRCSTSLRTSTSSIFPNSTSASTSGQHLARQFSSNGGTMHRVRWLRNRELGGNGCGSTPMPSQIHRYERAKGYYTSSPLPPTTITASFRSRLGSRRPGAAIDESPPLVAEGSSGGGGGGGMGCDGPVRVWSNLKNISHLYHVVPLDQSEAEITLEELSHPDVFSDTRIGCSVQLLHSQGANREQQQQSEERQRQQQQQQINGELQQALERGRRAEEEAEAARRRAAETSQEVQRQQRPRRQQPVNPEPAPANTSSPFGLEAPQTSSARVSMRRSESANVLSSGTSTASDSFTDERPTASEAPARSADPHERLRQHLATPPRSRPLVNDGTEPSTAAAFLHEAEIVRSTSSARNNLAPSTPSRARLRRSQQQNPTGTASTQQQPQPSAAPDTTEPMAMEEGDVPASIDANADSREGSRIRMQRRRSTVSAAALSALSGPHVKVVSTTTPLAYKRRGGEDLLAQIFEAGVHCRPRHKYVSFVDVPLPPVPPAIGWPGLEEFLARFKSMCTMSGVAIVNESRDRRRRVFVGKSSGTSEELGPISGGGGHSPIVQKPSTHGRFSVQATPPPRAHPLRHSSSAISNSASVVSVSDEKKEDKESSSGAGSGSRSLDWILVRERATMIIDLRRPLTNYGSFWNEHYFRRRLSMPMHGTVLAARSDPVFAAKNPDVISHYLGEANNNPNAEHSPDSGPSAPWAFQGGRPRNLPPPLVPSDPTIVHQSYTLTFYPDLDGNFSASLEYLTLHSPNCSVSSVDHVRRRLVLKRLTRSSGGATPSPPAPGDSQEPRNEASSDEAQQPPRENRHGRQSRRGSQVHPHGYSSNIWRSIEDVVAGLKVPESSKSTHTYKQETLDRVIELLKERTCDTLAQEELQHRLGAEAVTKQLQAITSAMSQLPANVLAQLNESTRVPVWEDENADDVDTLRQFGVLESIEEEAKLVAAATALGGSPSEQHPSLYCYAPPVRWTFLPSLQFYQTRISL